MKSDGLNKFSDCFPVPAEYLKLVVVVFAANLMAKAGVLSGGFAVDDYVFSLGLIVPEHIELFLSQGRFIAAGVAYAMHMLGVHLTDTYVAFGLLAILLHAAFVVSILRFVGADRLPGAGLVGVLMVVHPYGAEILTFKVALPYYCLALLFSILVLEILKANPSSFRARVYAVTCALGVVFTYQIFLNYFAVVMVFAWLFGKVVGDAGHSPQFERAKSLAIVTLFSVVVFMLAMQALKALELVFPTGRSELIQSSELPRRAEEIVSLWGKMFFESEPIMPAWLKLVVLALLFLSLSALIPSFLFNKQNRPGRWNGIAFIGALFLLAPLAVGMTLPFKDWWPVPRVLSHVAVIIGLIFMLSDLCLTGWAKRYLGLVNYAGRFLLVVGFVLISNQIFEDQRRINHWDRSMATRLISRLEMDPGFNRVAYLHVSGGWWAYPAGIKTVQGDLNTSAFNVPWSKMHLIVSSTGYGFNQALGDRAVRGEEYCSSAPVWPAVESTKVDGDLAIVCLKKN